MECERRLVGKDADALGPKPHAHELLMFAGGEMDEAIDAPSDAHHASMRHVMDEELGDLHGTIGNHSGASLRLHVVGASIEEDDRLAPRVVRARVEPGWTEVHIITSVSSGDKKTQRYFRLIPAHDEARIEASPTLFVAGRF